MPSKKDWENAEAAEQLKAIFDSPILLHVVTTIYVHERAEKGNTIKCKCCGSKQAKIVETINDLELLVDRVTGERRLRRDVVNKQRFDELAKEARRIEIPIRCYRNQLSLIISEEHKIIQALAGNRAGKTTCGVYWFIRQWMLKGGKGAVFWWVSPQRAQTQIGVRKLVTGEYTDRFSPPAFPMDKYGKPILAISWPDSERATKQVIRMLDGSIIALQHASKPEGDNLKGNNVQAILVDETCAIKHKANWTVLLARLIDSRGSIFSATTPKPGHWLKEQVVDASTTNKDILLVNLSSRDNPWISQDEVERTIKASNDTGEVSREIDGQWVSDNGNLWVHFDPRKHTVDEIHFNMIKDQKDITSKAVRDWWKGQNPYVKSVRCVNPKYVAGMDVNCNPMTAVICKIFGNTDNPKDWGIYVVDVVQQFKTETWKFGDYLKSESCRQGRVSYEGIPIALDPTACNHDPTMTRDKAIKFGKNAGKTLAELGFDARSANYSKKGASVGISRHATTGLLQNLMREGRLIINATRCDALYRALTEQQNDGNGLAVKESHTSSDKLSSPIDALAYLAWALFHKEELGEKKEIEFDIC